MEFTCKRCGLTCCGTPMGTEQICEDCFNKLHKDNMGVNIKEDKGMKFVDAIEKYNKITNDGGKTYYYAHKVDGVIFYNKGNSVSYSIDANINLITSTGWEEYKEHKLIVPERVDYSKQYSYIESDGSKVYTDSDCRFDEDADRLKTFNYFTDKELAQYIADKQLIDRVYLVLDVLNENRFNTLDRLELIDTYIDNNYKEVLDRINEYESRNRV